MTEFRTIAGNSSPHAVALVPQCHSLARRIEMAATTRCCNSIIPRHYTNKHAKVMLLTSCHRHLHLLPWFYSLWNPHEHHIVCFHCTSHKSDILCQYSVYIIQSFDLIPVRNFLVRLWFPKASWAAGPGSHVEQYRVQLHRKIFLGMVLVRARVIECSVRFITAEPSH